MRFYTETHEPAAVLFLAKSPEGKKLLAKIERKHGKGKALSILAPRIGRAVYLMLENKVPLISCAS